MTLNVAIPHVATKPHGTACALYLLCIFVMHPHCICTVCPCPNCNLHPYYDHVMHPHPIHAIHPALTPLCWRIRMPHAPGAAATAATLGDTWMSAVAIGDSRLQ